MIGGKGEEMQISEAQLRAMTADMVEMHEATFPQMRARLAEWSASLRRTRRQELQCNADRRRLVLTGGGLVLGSMVLSACGGSSKSSADQGANPAASAATGGDPSAAPSAAPALSAGDMSALQLNAALENLAVFAYGAALTAAPKGMFGKTVPPAVAEFATTAKKQHTDHAAAFNAALTGAGGQAYTDPDPTLAPAVTAMFAKVNSIPKLAMLALTLENTAAATYIQQMGTLTSPQALGAVATIAPVERQHAAILSFVLGDYPVPDTFVKLTKTATSLGAQPVSNITAGAGSGGSAPASPAASG